jgi:hypothetical protein
MNPLFQLAKELCPQGGPEDHPFPNHTDEDIWCNGFMTACELMLTSFYMESTEVTKRILAKRLRSELKIKLK